LPPSKFILAAVSSSAKTSQTIQSQGYIHSYSSLFECVHLSRDGGHCLFKSATLLYRNTKKKYFAFPRAQSLGAEAFA